MASEQKVEVAIIDASRLTESIWGKFILAETPKQKLWKFKDIQNVGNSPGNTRNLE